jgi:hypothetical protein
MPTRRTCHRCARGLLVVGLLTACGKKEQPAPQAQETPPPTTVAATTLPPPPTPVPTPPPVWRTTHWGMKKAEVLAALPEAQKLPNPVPFGKAQAGAGTLEGTSDLTIPSYEMEGVPFRVLFGFEADALNRVHLYAIKPGPSTCDDFVKSLAEKHGAAVSRERPEGSLKFEAITWKKTDQTITLTCSGVASLGFQQVTLDYKAPEAQTAKQ